MTSTSEWMHHFHTTNNPPPPPQQSQPPLFTTTNNTTQSTNPTPQMGPEGRVSKPSRRRTRASRRTPTTLLNTDTTNFRAMVQQFTGGPSFSSPPAQPSGGVLGSLGFGGPTRAQMMAGPVSGFGILGMQNQQQPMIQYGNVNGNHTNLGDLFINSTPTSDNRGTNNGGFQF